jgi:hypothetical protein
VVAEVKTDLLKNGRAIMAREEKKDHHQDLKKEMIEIETKEKICQRKKKQENLLILEKDLMVRKKLFIKEDSVKKEDNFQGKDVILETNLLNDFKSFQ